jgi:non-canonical purine NTP pyrophosphatase (RdgB/HAM1 family)
MLYFITGNAGKFREIKAIIPDIEQLELDLDEIQSLDARTVIEHKLAQAALHHDGDFIVEDTSLELTCLKGLPGTYIKWFEKTLTLPGIAALAMKYEDHSATARTTIGYRDAKGKTHYFSGELKGEIVPPRGDGGFGWDPIFIASGGDRTNAELTTQEKNRISMRQAAARHLAAYLQEHS